MHAAASVPSIAGGSDRVTSETSFPRGAARGDLGRARGHGGRRVRLYEPGRLVLFASDRNGGSDIYVMRSDGSGFHDLTPNTIVNFEPKWSRDGKRIVFVRSFADGFSEDGNGEIATMAPDGAACGCSRTRPARTPTPAWSPTGGRSSSAVSARTTPRTLRHDADGKQVRQLTEDGESNSARGLVARRQVDRLVEQTRLAPGGDLRHAVHGPGRVRAAHAQRQLRRRARVVAGREADRVPSTRSGNDEIWVIGSDGSHPKRLTNDRHYDGRPSLVGRRQRSRGTASATGRPGSG